MSARGPLDFEDDGPAPAPAPPRRVPPPARTRSSQVTWIVGVVVFALLVYVTINTLRNTDNPGARGLPGGRPLPPFATPLALSTLNGDANVAREAGAGGAGHVPACSVRGPRVLNVCQLAERGPVVLAFMAAPSGKCARQLDEMQRVRASFPGVQFAAVGIRGSRGSLRSLIRRHGWRFPVGYDHDGAVANVYSVGVCPTVTFAYAGGIVMHTTVGLLDQRGLVARVRQLVARSEERGWKPPAAR